MSRRVPWWVWAVLLPCAGYLVVLWGVLVAGPEPLGCDLRTEAEGLRVTTVTPGSPAERAGLRPGDLVVAVNGKSGRAAQWEVRPARVGQEIDASVEREGARARVVWSLGRKGRAFCATPKGLAHLADVWVAALCTLLAWLIVFRGRPDPTSRVGALMLALWPVGSYFVTGSPPGFHAAIRALPPPIAALPVGGVLLASALLTDRGCGTRSPDEPCSHSLRRCSASWSSTSRSTRTRAWLRCSSSAGGCTPFSPRPPSSRT